MSAYIFTMNEQQGHNSNLRISSYQYTAPNIVFEFSWCFHYASVNLSEEYVTYFEGKKLLKRLCKFQWEK